MSEDVQILRIRRVHWLAAVRATFFENRQTANGETPMLNSDGEQIDLLTQELERADNGEQTNALGNLGGTGSDGNIGLGAHERTASDNAMENEKFLPLNAPLTNTPNSAKVSFDSPTSSGRNTPTLAAMQKRSILRPDGSTPPSLTGGNSSSKNRSLT